MIGGSAEREPKLVRRIAEAGHLVGNHSWSHPNLALTGARQVEEELRRTNETLEQILERLSGISGPRLADGGHLCADCPELGSNTCDVECHDERLGRGVEPL